jgi:hypothetical protein
MGRRTHLRLARQMSPIGQRLGNIHRLVNRLGAHRQHPFAHTQNRKILLRMTNF